MFEINKPNKNPVAYDNFQFVHNKSLTRTKKKLLTVISEACHLSCFCSTKIHAFMNIESETTSFHTLFLMGNNIYQDYN